jgi:hypothetical protein
LALGLALAGVVVASYGGDPSLSSRQLRVDAARICAAAGGRTAQIVTPLVPSGGETFLRRGLTAFTSELAQLRRLRPPRQGAHTYSVALDALARKLSLMRATVRGLERGADPVPAVQALQARLAPIEAREDAAWHALDVPACLNR